MKVCIVAIGKSKQGSPEQELFDMYKKRSGWSVEVREKNNATQQEEAEFLQKSIPNGAKVVVLDEKGENLSSLELAHKIEAWQSEGCSEICFLIGGADGHLPQTREKADLILSFGRLTMPHMLFRTVLMEQIYRVQAITSGHPYHRA